MAPKQVLIVGNAGYIGPVLVAHLRRQHPGLVISGLDAGWFAHCLTEARLPERALDVQYFADTRDLGPQHLQGVDAVVQLAAVSNDPMGTRFEAVTEAINHQAAVRVARLAQQAGVGHFVFASSCSVYGFAADGAARSEQDAVDPLTAYARSKIATEQALAALPPSPMVISCLRFATACGFSPRLRLDLVLNDFVASALATGGIEVLSDGSPWRPLIDVRDMARAIDWALQRPASAGGPILTVNVGADDWNYQVRDLAEAVAAAVGNTRVQINTAAPPDRRSYRVSFARYRALAPAHQPQETLASSIAGLIAGLKAQGFADANFRRSALIRLNVLQGLVDSEQLDPQLRWSHDAH